MFKNFLTSFISKAPTKRTKIDICKQSVSLVDLSASIMKSPAAIKSVMIWLLKKLFQELFSTEGGDVSGILRSIINMLKDVINFKVSKILSSFFKVILYSPLFPS